MAEVRAEDWDKDLTTNQNYEKFGIARNMNKQVEILAPSKTDEAKRKKSKSEADTAPEQSEGLNPDVDYEVDIAAIKELNKSNKVWKSDNPVLKKLFKEVENESVKKLIRKPKVNKDEMASLEQLVKKHKDNYKAMRRDTKTNVFQFTESQIQRKLAEMIKRKGEEEMRKLLGDKMFQEIQDGERLDDGEF